MTATSSNPITLPGAAGQIAADALAGGDLVQRTKDFDLLAAVQAVQAAVTAAGPLGTQPVSGTVAVSNLPATQAVSAAALPLPAGAATASGVAAVATAVANASAATQAVSAASLPLPSGAATAAKQDAIVTAIGAIPAAPSSVAVTGVATAANQSTEIASLATIATNSGTAATAAKQDTGNTSLATIATNSGTAATAANQATEISSLATIATNSGAQATASKQDTINTSIGTVKTSVDAVKTDIDGLRAQLPTSLSSGLLSVTDAAAETSLASIAANTATAGNQQTEISTLSTLLDQAVRYLSMMASQMPRIDGAKRIITSQEANTAAAQAVTVSSGTVTTVSTVTALTSAAQLQTVGSSSKPLDSAPLHWGAAGLSALQATMVRS